MEYIIHTIKSNQTYPLEVVGESFYQSVYELVCGKRTTESVERYVDALIVPDKNNPYDPNAFRVLLRNQTAGHLPRQAAKILREFYDKHNLGDNVALSVKAVIRGGWEREGEKGNYGMWLDLPAPDEIYRQITQREAKPKLQETEQTNEIKTKTKNITSRILFWMMIVTALVFWLIGVFVVVAVAATSIQ